MKNLNIRRCLSLIGCFVLASLGSSAMATTWDVGTSGTTNGCTSTAVAGTTTATVVGTTTYTVSGVGNTLGCGAWTTATGTTSTLQVSAFSTASSSGSTLTAGTAFAKASAVLYSGNGLGVVNKYEDANSPTHTADNQNGTDVLLFNFGSAVNLSNITIGWWANDYDITLLAYTGVGAPTIDTKTLTTDFTSAKNWTSVNLGSGTTTVATNTGGTSSDDKNLSTSGTALSGTYSSWWMVSAYNSGYGAANSLGNDTVSDFVKVLSIAGNACVGAQCGTTSVPEPGSLALVGAALMGFVATRRRKLQAV